MTRVIVIGAGAVGALLAAQLHQADVPTVLVARGENLAAIRANGLTVHRPHGSESVAVSVAGSPADVELTRDDILVIATKAQDAEQAVTDWAWRPLTDGGLAAELPVVTIHNGLAAEAVALRRFARVHGATMWIAASHLAPGEVVSPSWPTVGVAWIGPLGAATADESAAIAATFTRAGVRAHAVSDIAGVKAHKLLGNLSNALDLFEGDDAQIARVREALGAEARAAYAAAGITIVDPIATHGPVDLKIGTVPGHDTTHRSTWQSFARGSNSEVDYLNGEIVLLGRQYGVPTPVNERVQQVLGVLAATGGGAAPRDIATIHHLIERTS